MPFSILLTAIALGLAFVFAIYVLGCIRGKSSNVRVRFG
jgi:hypothetical protein